MEVSFPAKFFERKSRVFEDFQKQTLRKISAMHRNHKQRPFRMFQDQMRASLAGSSIALPLQKAKQLSGFWHLFEG